MDTYSKEELIHEDFCEKGALSHILGRSNVHAGNAGRRRQDMHWSRVLEKGDPVLRAPALLPGSSPVFITQ